MTCDIRNIVRLTLADYGHLQAVVQGPASVAIQPRIERCAARLRFGFASDEEARALLQGAPYERRPSLLSWGYPFSVSSRAPVVSPACARRDQRN